MFVKWETEPRWQHILCYLQEGNIPIPAVYVSVLSQKSKLGKVG